MEYIAVKVNFKFPPSLIAAVRVAAAAEGRTLSGYVRNVLARAIARNSRENKPKARRSRAA